MVEIIFFSDSNCSQLYPLNFGKCESSIHFGARSIANQWKDALSIFDTIRIKLNSRLLPTSKSIDTIIKMNSGDRWIQDEILIAEIEGLDDGEIISPSYPADLLNSSIEVFEKCSFGIGEDLERMKVKWRTRTLAEDERSTWAKIGVFISGPMERIHIGSGVIIKNCSLNTENGDIILGNDSEIMEGVKIRGPFALGANSQIKMGALVYGPTTVGSYCKVGGEINNSVIHDYSNKAHEGFLGNSVIGPWCNLGAMTTTSNLKNNYSEIKVWNAAKNGYLNSGKIFCGLLMGEHSKTAINTSFNTGTVVGAFCNVFGYGNPEKHISSFTWGGVNNSVPHDLDKAIETVKKVMGRRGIRLCKEEEVRIKELYNSSTFGIS
ncbi:MAG: hypothetical protein CL850_04200 [Crocinitomicaceae bacterium]|nr:hypothetical protein [Crocinitomicaceae bacterium]